MGSTRRRLMLLAAVFVVWSALSGTDVEANGANCDGVFGSGLVGIVTNDGQEPLGETDKFVGNIDVDKTTTPYVYEGAWTHTAASGDRWVLNTVTSVACDRGLFADIRGTGTRNGEGAYEFRISMSLPNPAVQQYCPATEYAIKACDTSGSPCLASGDFTVNGFGYISRGTFQIR